MLMVYEVGVIWVGGGQADRFRGGADAWLRGGLGLIGLSEPWWPPVLIIVGLMSWQWIARLPWTVSLETLGGMFAESVLFAFGLILLGQLEGHLFAKALSELSGDALPNVVVAALSHSELATIARALSYVGAGIYEEVLFRLTLLPLVTAMARQTILPRSWAPATGAIATSFLFAAAHHWGPAGEPFELFRFLFRMIAGTVFATLFVLRGFGITVGSHAIYDLLVGVLLSE